MDRLIEKFWARVSPEPNTGCWLWIGESNGKGYGRLHVENGRRILAHRLAWEVHRGPIVAGLELDHLCRVRCCVNPEHLEPVTHRENVGRGEAGKPQREKKACDNGHAYTEENTYRYVTRSGIHKRYCKECNRVRAREWLRQKRSG